MQSDAHILEWPHEDVVPARIHAKARKALRDVNNWFMENPSDENKAGDEEVLLFPIIQAGQFKIYDEEECLNLLFEHLAKSDQKTEVDLTSGYFGLYKSYQDGTVNSTSNYHVIAASPQVWYLSVCSKKTFLI